MHKIVPILVATLFDFTMIKSEVVIKKENGFVTEIGNCPGLAYPWWEPRAFLTVSLFTRLCSSSPCTDNHGNK